MDEIKKALSAYAYEKQLLAEAKADVEEAQRHLQKRQDAYDAANVELNKALNAEMELLCPAVA